MLFNYPNYTGLALVYFHDGAVRLLTHLQYNHPTKMTSFVQEQHTFGDNCRDSALCLSWLLCLQQVFSPNVYKNETNNIRGEV